MFYYGLYIAFLNSQMPSFKIHLKTYLFKQAYNYFKFFFMIDVFNYLRIFNLVYCYIFFRFPFFSAF